MRHSFLITYFKWGHKKNRLLLTVSLLLAMVASVSIQGFRLFETLNKTQDDKILPPVTPPQPVALKQENFKLLFGSNERPEAKADNADIPKTKLNLVLRGALAGLHHKKYGSAIVQGANQDKLYEIGDSLPGGVILTEVFSDHVVLNRGGQFETLYFADTDKNSMALQEYKPAISTKKEPVSRPGYTDSPDGKPLEQRMQELRDKLQEANQGN